MIVPFNTVEWDRITLGQIKLNAAAAHTIGGTFFNYSALHRGTKSKICNQLFLAVAITINVKLSQSRTSLIAATFCLLDN